MATWKSLDQYAPFAQILVRYMWEARPPLNPNQFAIRAGLRRQILSQWLNAPASAELHPDPAAVVKVARAMGVPVADLLIAAGHATEADPLVDYAGAWAYVLRHVESSPAFAQEPAQEGTEPSECWDEPTRERVLAFLRACEAEDAAVHQADISAARQPHAAQGEASEASHDSSIEAQDTADAGDTASDTASDAESPAHEVS